LAVKHFLGVYGHTNLDYIIEVPRLPRANTSIQFEGERLYFGGTGGNLARLASRMGVSVALASFVGRDFPTEYEAALKKSGVDTTELRRVNSYGTPKVWIFTDPEGNQMAVVDQGPMKDAAKLPLMTKAAKGSEWVHFCTGRPEYYSRIADIAAKAGKFIAVDPAQEIHYVYNAETLRAMVRRADLFFGNHNEIAEAVRLLRVKAARGLLKFVQAVIETRGSRGSLIHEEDGTTEVPLVSPHKVVDPTGAGDAFRAGFYAGLSRGHDFVVCAILGSSAASYAVEKKGPQSALPTYREVLGRARKCGVF